MIISQLIEKLQRLEKFHGEKEVTVYKAYDQKTARVLGSSDVFFDEKDDSVNIAIYD